MGRRAWVVSPAAIVLGVLVLIGFRALPGGASPWIELLAIGGAVALVLDGAWSWFALRSPVVRCHAPSDAVVGRPHPATLAVDRPTGRLVVEMTSLVERERVVVDAPGGGVAEVVPDHRGVFDSAVLAITSAAPLGLISVRREVSVTLPTPVVVAPRTLPVGGFVVPMGGSPVDDGSRLAGRSGDLTRGVRQYRPGDGQRSVHWPATARSRELMVRELEQWVAPTVVLLVDLGPLPGRAAEEVASRAMWVGDQVLAGGQELLLVTREAQGTVAGSEADSRSVGRRLAHAVTGPPIDIGAGLDQGLGPGGVPRGPFLELGPGGLRVSSAGGVAAGG